MIMDAAFLLFFLLHQTYSCSWALLQQVSLHQCCSFMSEGCCRLWIRWNTVSIYAAVLSFWPVMRHRLVVGLKHQIWPHRAFSFFLPWRLRGWTFYTDSVLTPLNAYHGISPISNQNFFLYSLSVFYSASEERVRVGGWVRRKRRMRGREEEGGGGGRSCCQTQMKIQRQVSGGHRR